MIRAVFFDVGGVIARLDEEALCIEWSDRLGLDIQGIYDALYAGNDDTAQIGRVLVDDWWETVRQRLGLDADAIVEFRKSFASCWRWDTRLIDFMASLRPRIRTALLSNAWSDLRSIVEARGASGSIDALICSAEVGVAKPDPEIFRIACSRLGVDPSESLFVDDVIQNVDAARSLGMHGIVHTSAEQTIADVVRMIV
jgi:putative hydrolase of the HAD superfamily